MKKQVLVTLTLVGMTLAACSKKDSYRAAKIGSDNSGGLNTEASSEQKALEILEKDTTFKSVHDNELSENLKDSIKGIEIKQTVQETENTEIAVTQFTILDKNSKDCSPVELTTSAGLTIEALRAGVKVKGQYRLQCIDTDCNDLLFFKEQAHTDANSAVAIPVGTVQGSAVVRLSKDENGVYKPIQSESDVFAKAQSVDEAIEKCLADKAAESAAKARDIEARKEYASSRSKSESMVRLSQIDKEIRAIDAKIKALAPARFSFAERSELNSKRAQLMEERAIMIKNIQKANSKAEMIDPVGDMKQGPR